MQGGKGSYRVGGVIIERRASSCRRRHQGGEFSINSNGDRTRKDVPSDQSGALAGGQLSLHGSGRNSGQQGLPVGQFIDLGVIRYTAPLQQSDDAVGSGFDDLLDVRRRC